MDKENLITCPECGAEIDVNEVLYHQLEERVKKDFDMKNAKRQRELERKLKEIDEEKKRIEETREDLKKEIEAGIQKKLREEKARIEKAVRSQIEGENSERLKELEEEIQAKSAQLKELNKTKAEVERLKREKDCLREEIALEKEQELTKRLSEEKQRIQKQLEESSFFKIKEKEKIIDQLKEQLEDAKRKAEQGSVQLQGEVQEIEIENLLRQLYPIDEITEVKKGQRGADVLHEVRNSQGSLCGKIYYESKRTKDFQKAWLDKLKNDNLQVKADILVLVSEALPEGTDKYGLHDGIWICSFHEVKALSLVLRHSIIQVHTVNQAHKGKGTKMELLYEYLTSNEFRSQFEAIMKGFKELQDSYFDEKLKMQKIWKEREKQLDRILANAVDFYGSLKGIAGSSIPQVEMLETNEADLLE